MARAVRVLVDDLQSGRRNLVGEAAHYLSRVHRLRVGDSVVLVEPARGVEACAQLLQVGREVLVEVGPVEAGLRRGLPGLQLVWGIGKGDKLEEVVRAAVVLGAARLWLVETARSVPRLGEGKAKKRERWTALIHDAMRQCERADLLELLGPAPAREVLQQSTEFTRVVLQPDAQAAPLLDVLRRATLGDNPMPIQLWIGPEGGFDQSELTQLSEQGAVFADLGPLILRTEMAANTALALAAAVLRRA